MSERTSIHRTFTLERVYDVPAARVFSAFADPVAKQRWFRGPAEWARTKYALDFRVGGSESSSVGPPEGPAHIFEARYYDIVPDERIVFAYEMYFDELRISVSLTTIELSPEGDGTRLTFTEQGVFLDDYDNAVGREEGSVGLLDALGAELSGVAVEG